MRNLSEMEKKQLNFIKNAYKSFSLENILTETINQKTCQSMKF